MKKKKHYIYNNLKIAFYKRYFKKHKVQLLLYKKANYASNYVDYHVRSKQILAIAESLIKIYLTSFFFEHRKYFYVTTNYRFGIIEYGVTNLFNESIDINIPYHSSERNSQKLILQYVKDSIEGQIKCLLPIFKNLKKVYKDKKISRGYVLSDIKPERKKSNRFGGY